MSTSPQAASTPGKATIDPRGRYLAPSFAAAGTFIVVAPSLPQPLKAASVVFALVAPGGAAISILLSRREQLDVISWFSLSVITSMALIPLLVLLLNATGAHLEAHDMGHMIGGVTVGLAAVLALSPAPAGGVLAPVAPFSLRAGAGWLVGALVGVAIVGLGAAYLPEPKPVSYFRFQLNGPWRYLSQVVAPRSSTLTVSLLLKNEYPEARTYTVAPTLAGAGQWKPVTFTVAKDGYWTGTITGPVPHAAGCFNRMAINLRSAGKTNDLAVLTFYVKGRSACPGLTTTPA